MTSDVADGSRRPPLTPIEGASPDPMDGRAGLAADARASVTIGGRPFPIRPHHCFACGSTNVAGIGLPLHVEGDSCWTELELPDRFEGWQGIAHGGIVATILDEVMAWSLVDRDEWGLTARMSIDFKHPVPIGRWIRAEGRLDEQRRRLLRTSARLLDPVSGTLYATAEGLYIAAPEERRQALKRAYGFGAADPAAAPGDPAGTMADPPGGTR